jgi:hypothetical protein
MGSCLDIEKASGFNNRSPFLRLSNKQQFPARLLSESGYGFPIHGEDGRDHVVRDLPSGHDRAPALPSRVSVHGYVREDARVRGCGCAHGHAFRCRVNAHASEHERVREHEDVCVRVSLP